MFLQCIINFQKKQQSVNFLKNKTKIFIILGHGFDRHLLGLKITSERLKMPLPEFFNSKTYAEMNHFVLSTSTLSTDTIVFGGFGPVVDDGFGIGYNVTSKLGAIISSYKV